MSKVRHVLGISGGKDSTALAVYLRKKYPMLDIEYYFCDTGKELPETYELLTNLESVLGKKIERLEAAKNSPEGNSFDHFLELYGGYLPSSASRWCTRKLKLEPFEKFVADDLVISYVAIRGDENREAYISKKPNIQSIFPFRKNIWSEDVISAILNNKNISTIRKYYSNLVKEEKLKAILETIEKPISQEYYRVKKLNTLLDFGIELFNKVVFEFLEKTDYPLSKEKNFPLISNTDVFNKEDVFTLLNESGIGLPKYYDNIEFKLDNKLGYYHRSRSGCFFCFYQQKIEWIWLYEQHKDLFKKAMEYEKKGYTWIQGEKLQELIKPERIKQIKEDYLLSNPNKPIKATGKLIDILDDGSTEGCAVCFI